jgi:hypothetical protein
MSTTRPTIQDLANYLNIGQPSSVSDAADYSAMFDSLETAIEALEAIVSTALLADEGFDLAVSTTNYSNSLRRAVLKYAAKLYKERSAPEGGGEFGGQTFKVGPSDGEWFGLIERFVEDGFA